MSASRAKPNSGRREQYKEEIPIYITASRVSSLNNIKIDTILQKILSDSGCVIQITLGPDNQAITQIVDVESKKRVGGLADISRLAGFRKFATDEKKRSSVAEVLYPVEEKAYRVYEDVRTSSRGFVPARLGGASIAALKESNNMVEILLANRKIIEPKLTALHASVKATAETIIAWIEKSLIANTQLVARIIQGGEIKGYLKDRLFESSTPEWAYNKLSRTKLADVEGFDFRRILFPVDAKKGLCFTVRELRDANFLARNMFILSMSGFQKTLVSDQDLLKLICSTDEPVDIDNEASVFGTQLRNEKVLITAPYYDLEFLFGGKAKGKFGSFSVKPDYSGPRAALKSIVEVVLCVQSFEMQVSDQRTDVWAKIASGKNVNFWDNISAKRNLFYVALEHKADLASRIESIYKLETPGSRALVFEWVRTVGRFSTDSKLLIAITKMLGVRADDLTQDEKVKMDDSDNHSGVYAISMLTPNRPVYAPVIQMTKKIETSLDRMAFAEFRNAIGTAEMGAPKKKKSKSSPITQLTDPAKAAIKMIAKNRRCAFLKEPIEDWMRGFVSDKLQIAAAGIVLAQFDSLLDEDLDSDGSDSDSDTGSNAGD